MEDYDSSDRPDEPMSEAERGRIQELSDAAEADELAAQRELLQAIADDCAMLIERYGWTLPCLTEVLRYELSERQLDARAEATRIVNDQSAG